LSVPKAISVRSRPLGIFDSGIGGLTVADAIRERMPGEQLVYFGDTAHLPYGDKSEESIKKWSVCIADFLLAQGCKAIVIACNSISAVAYSAVKKRVGPGIPVINVIDPVVGHVCSEKNFKHVGVIGTKATIRANVYAAKLNRKRPDMTVSSLATPLLAPMIEEGFFNNSISRTIINDYLSRTKLKKIDSLILGCTHYPLIRPEIDAFYKGRIEVFDAAGIVADAVKAVLDSENLSYSGKRKPQHHFYVSEYTTAFEKSTRIFFKGKVRLQQKNLWR
jgi:glutamate racemase